MACVTASLPIQEIQAASAFCVGLPASPVGPWFKRLTYFYAAPKILKFLADALPNERIQKMTHEDAASVYLPLVSVHRAFAAQTDYLETHHPLLAKTVLRGQIQSTRLSLERLADISEALAWSADEQLRHALERSIDQIDQREFHLT